MNDADKRETDRGLGLQLSPERVRLLAVEAGFADAGLIALPFAEEARTGERFAAWIAEGKAGSMEYLARRCGRASETPFHGRVRRFSALPATTLRCRARSTHTLTTLAGLRVTPGQAASMQTVRAIPAITTRS